MDTELSSILSLLKNTSKEEREFIKKVYEFTKKIHDGQKRNSGEPYFNHLFATAKNLADLGMSTTTVARVAHWLNQGMGGYRLVIARVSGSK